MSPETHRLLDAVDADDLATLEGAPLDELRAARAACVEVETGLSYLRRLVQGALEIVGRELARRAGGGDPLAVADLVDELPDILSEVPRPGGVGRLTQDLEPTIFDPELTAEYEALVGGGRVAKAAEMHGPELASLLDGLTALEERVSAKRRREQERIDALAAELARRYRTGEASVDELLR